MNWLWWSNLFKLWTNLCNIVVKLLHIFAKKCLSAIYLYFLLFAAFWVIAFALRSDQLLNLLVSHASISAAVLTVLFISFSPCFHWRNLSQRIRSQTCLSPSDRLGRFCWLVLFIGCFWALNSMNTVSSLVIRFWFWVETAGELLFRV